MLITTFLGQPTCLIILTAIVALAHSTNMSLVLALACALGAMLINTTAKHFIHRTRPDTLYVSHMYFKSSSFPSGHAFGGAVVCGLLAYMTATNGYGWLSALLVAQIAVSGVSRIYLGAHYPTDVVAGWLAGGVLLWLIIGVLQP